MSVWNDILAQADNLVHVIDSHVTHSRTELDRAVQICAKTGRIIFAGVGSGLNATIPACTYLMKHGFPAQYVDATEAIYGITPGLVGSVLVLNTRSGETIELVKLAKMARQSGIPSIAVTNEPGSTVGKLADICIPTYSRWDDLVVISAYGGMLASELVLCSHLAGEMDTMLSDLRATAAQIQPVLDKSIEMREKVSALFDLANPIYLLGRGASVATCLAGELVLEEMARQPSITMAAGLFRQGPIEVVDERFRAVIFEGAGEQAVLNASLARDLIRLGAGIFWLGATRLEGALILQLPGLPDHVLPLLEIIPIYILAYDLAQRKGFQPGTVRYIQKIITNEMGNINQSNADSLPR